MNSKLTKSDNIITVDCRAMEPPEPMVAVLEQVEVLEPDQKIIMLHRKEPKLIYSKLKERDCDYSLETFPDDSVALTIWKAQK